MHLRWLQQDMSGHLGAECDSIAQAIVAGRGFSDPFQEPSGPTAWMPPVLPYLTAAVYWLTGNNRSYVIDFFVTLHAIAVLLMGWIVIRQARRLQITLFGYVVLITGLSANFHQLFQTTHDSGLLLLVVSILWIGIVKYWDRLQSARNAILWGIFGGIIALCSPAIGFAWSAITSARLLLNRDGKIGQRIGYLILSALMAMVIVTPWTIRNRVVLGKWIPIKPNGMYELWQSQCLDDDGVLDWEACSFHPWPSAGEQRQRYKDVGEIAFIEEKGEIAKASIRMAPMTFVNRVANRWFASCIYYSPFYAEYELYTWPILFKRLVFPIPWLSILLVLAIRKSPLSPEILAAIWICVLCLIPYILISYYERYATPLLGMKLLLVVFAIDAIWPSRRPKNRAA